MKNIRYGFSVDDRFLLEKLINSKSQLIYADRLIRQYQENCVEAGYFVVPFAEGLGFKLSAVWNECKETLDDYCSIVVSEVDFEVSGTTSIFSFFDQSHIVNVSILCKSLVNGGALIEHEFGILIKRKDGKEIVFIGGESAFQNILIIDDSLEVSSIINGRNVTIESLG